MTGSEVEALVMSLPVDFLVRLALPTVIMDNAEMF